MNEQLDHDSVDHAMQPDDTPELRALVSLPGSVCFSATITSRPFMANALAIARPITPAPMMSTSISSIYFGSITVKS